MHRALSEGVRLSRRTPEERRLLLFPEAGSIDVREKILLEVVVASDVNDGTVFFEETHSPAPAALVEVFDPDVYRGTDARERVREERNHRPVTEANER